jgi:hypothetical protein
MSCSFLQRGQRIERPSIRGVLLRRFAFVVVVDIVLITDVNSFIRGISMLKLIKSYKCWCGGNWIWVTYGHWKCDKCAQERGSNGAGGFGP